MDMAKHRKSLKKPRSLAFSRQFGICCYCDQPMWSGNPHEFALKYKITMGQAKRFQCTGEHLKAHKDGGRQHKIISSRPVGFVTITGTKGKSRRLRINIGNWSSIA